MPGKSNYWETRTLKDLFQASQARPSSMGISLHSATLIDLFDGAEISTVGTGYNRVSLGNSSANWGGATAAASSAANSTMFNKTVVTFASAAASYGPVVAAGVWDTTTVGGNLLYMSSFAGKTVEIGDIPQISSGDLRISED